MMSDKKTGYSPLNADNNLGVTNDVIFAYAHTKMNICFLFWAFFFLFFMILTWIHQVLYT